MSKNNRINRFQLNKHNNQLIHAKLLTSIWYQQQGERCNISGTLDIWNTYKFMETYKNHDFWGCDGKPENYPPCKLFLSSRSGTTKYFFARKHTHARALSDKILLKIITSHYKQDLPDLSGSRNTEGSRATGFSTMTFLNLKQLTASPTQNVITLLY